MAFLLGADIGGSHISAGLIDTNSRELVTHTLVRRKVDCTAAAEVIIAEWAACLQSVPGYEKAEQIGISMPGPFDYKNGISLIEKQEKFNALYGKSVRNLLSEALSFSAQKICFDNDAACFLKGEVAAGVAKGYQKVIGITLGTGLGSAFYTDGVAKDGALWDAPFRNSNAEAFISTAWFLARYHSITGKEIEDVKSIIDADMETAKQLFSEFAQNTLEFLLPYIEEQQTECLVLGGNISKAHHLFVPQLHMAFEKSGKPVAIRISELGEEAALIGAAFNHILID